VLFVFSIFIFWLLAFFAYVHAKRRNALFWSDIGLPAFVVIFWILLTVSGYGHQSLNNFVEVPIALSVSLVFLYSRIFVIDRYKISFKKNSYIVLGISLFFVILLRTFMPYLPE
jgi:hypothetical protein